MDAIEANEPTKIRKLLAKLETLDVMGIYSEARELFGLLASQMELRIDLTVSADQQGSLEQERWFENFEKTLSEIKRALGPNPLSFRLDELDTQDQNKH
ncbi:MAG: hypothetical protein HKL81_04360 [Acidimicrobiaceae bacterium]|nr:hypothetical protein [Acidimicrobiaceae bacterium]